MRPLTVHWTPDDIAATIGPDPGIKPEDVLYKYLMDEATIRFEPLKKYFTTFGLNLTEQEMVRLMTVQEDILFTEDADDRGRFWRASIVPDQYAGPAREGYLDHRVTDQFDDAMGQNFEGEEEDFAGRELAGINAIPEPSQMNSLGAEGAPGTLGAEGDADPGAFEAQPEPPDITLPATDQSEIPPAAIPQAMPDMVAQAMATQIPEPGILEPGMQFGPEDQVDMAQTPTQPTELGPGEEQPAPLTGPTISGVVPSNQIVPGQMVPNLAAQGMAQPQAPVQPDFGDDGADYTLDPFLNSFPEISNAEEESNPPQIAQVTNEPTMRQNTPKRYSRRMREAKEKRTKIDSQL